MVRRGLLVATVGVVLALSAGSAGAATLTVNTTIDEMTAGDGQCSLREAIQAVDDPSGPNSDCSTPGSGANTIVLGRHVYALRVIPAGPDDNTTGDLNVTAPVSGLTIVGAGEHPTTIKTSVHDRLLNVAWGANMTLRNLTLSGGHAPNGRSVLVNSPGGPGGNGGAVLNAGTLSLQDVAVTDSTAGNGGDGGAIYGPVPSGALQGPPGGAGGEGGGIFSSWRLSLINATITGNSAGSGGRGGDGQGSANWSGANGGPGGVGGAGGGVANSGVSVTIVGTTIADNTAGSGGDAGHGGSTNSANPGSGGAGGPGGDGGGIWSNGGFLSATNDTMARNMAGAGGPGGSGVSGTWDPHETPGASGGNGGTAGSGGGLADTGGATSSQNSVTIADNRLAQPGPGGPGGAGSPSGSPGSTGFPGVGGGVANLAPDMQMQNAVVASNVPDNCAGGFDGDHDITWGGGGCPPTFSMADPDLGPLQDNGGPTQTMALGPASAAIDEVPATGAGCQRTDQRGVRRPAGPACDIGAFEVAPPAVAAVAAVALGPRAVRLVVSVTANAGGGSAWAQYGRSRSYGRRSAVRGVSGVTPVRVSIVVRGLKLRAVYHYRIVVSTIDGTSRSADVRLAVPLLGSLRITPGAFALAHGATVSYSDSRPGVTTFAVQRRAGRRWITVGTFTHRDRAGRNSVRFGRGRGRFAPGVYRLLATPRNGRTIGVTWRVRFTIIR